LSKFKLPLSFRGEFLGLFFVAIYQFLMGVIHAVAGIFLLLAPYVLSSVFAVTEITPIFGVYTFLYGLLTLIFAYGLWTGNRWGWIGTTILCIIVIIEASSTLLLTLIQGIPIHVTSLDIAQLRIIDITLTFVVLLYLIQPHIKRSFSRIK
jgi:hypothetical protein